MHTPQAPPRACLPESSDSLPWDFMQQLDLTQTPLHYFLQRADSLPAGCPKGRGRLGLQLTSLQVCGACSRSDSG